MTSTETQPEPTPRGRLQPFASFRYRNYRWLWAANVCAGAVATTQGFLITWLFIEALDRVYNRGTIELMGALRSCCSGCLQGGWRTAVTGACCLWGATWGSP